MIKMLFTVMTLLTLAICHGFLHRTHHHCAMVKQRRRASTTVHTSPLNDDLSVFLLTAIMTEDERNFEILKLFAPAFIPFVFLTAFIGYILLQIQAIKDSTDKSIERNNNATDKLIQNNIASTEKIIAKNKEILDLQLDALSNATANQIKSFEAKFDQFFSNISRNKRL